MAKANKVIQRKKVAMIRRLRLRMKMKRKVKRKIASK